MAIAEVLSSGAEVRADYLEMLQRVERLHRHLLDVVKDELDRDGLSDLTSVQALLLFNIGDSILTAGELRTRGHYLGSNVSYNLKKLVDLGYIDQNRSEGDRRTVQIALTEKGHSVRSALTGLFARQSAAGAFNFNLSWWLLYWVGWLFAITFIGIVVAIPLWFVITVVALWCHIRGALNASSGRPYRYPFQLRVLS